MALVEKR